MALKTTVVVGNITNLSDARYCAGMGVDYLCFPAHRINPKTFEEITGWVSGPTFVLDVSQVGDIKATLEQYNTDHILLTTHQLEFLPILRGKKLIMRLESSLINLNFHTENQPIEILFLLAEESQIADLPREKGFSTLVKVQEASSLESLLQQKVAGIWLDGSDEDRPGLKDYSTLEVVLEQLETEA